jgi:hypothetical protein
MTDCRNILENVQRNKCRHEYSINLKNIGTLECRNIEMLEYWNVRTMLHTNLCLLEHKINCRYKLLTIFRNEYINKQIINGLNSQFNNHFNN